MRDSSTNLTLDMTRTGTNTNQDASGSVPEEIEVDQMSNEPALKHLDCSKSRREEESNSSIVIRELNKD